MKRRYYYNRRCGEYPYFFPGMDWMDNQYKGNQTAFEILKTRYAKGEISKDEYDRMRKDIS